MIDLPSDFKEVLDSGAWNHPGIEVLAEIFPEMEHPVNFLNTDTLLKEHHGLMFEDEIKSEVFREYRSSKTNINYELPWLDLDKAVFIVANTPAFDSAIVLDLRENPPVVLFSKWNSVKTQCRWVKVAEDFGALCKKLNINNVKAIQGH